MKANSKRTGLYLFVGALFLITFSLHAQSLQPEAWSSFVQRTDNHSVMDTFRLQTFQTNATDTWSYTFSGQTSIVDITELDASLQAHGTKALKLQKGSTVSFNSFNLTANVFDT